MRAGLAVTVAGIGLGAGGAATASAAPMPQGGGPVTLGTIDPQAAAQGTNVALHHTLAAVKDAKLDPLAGTGVDPLDNTVGTQIADFKPVSTKSVTGPLTQGGSLRTLPVAGNAAALLPG
jgi:D-arabinose 1-dehydrogenase-like Zn-dependent alcohol dehydrogenase